MRDLLFDAVLEAEANLPRRRTWTSVFEIPKGTLVDAAARTSPSSNQLYVNSRGKGWWIGGDAWRGTIEAAEQNGWTLTASYNKWGPFTEVLE